MSKLHRIKKDTLPPLQVNKYKKIVQRNIKLETGYFSEAPLQVNSVLCFVNPKCKDSSVNVISVSEDTPCTRAEIVRYTPQVKD